MTVNSPNKHHSGVRFEDEQSDPERVVVAQLGMTPRYLNPCCQEALHEVDVGVNEVRDRTDSAVANRDGAGDRRTDAKSAHRSP
ncbi:MAG: hypothetical protein NW703_08355 [Nitrospiraceae bacterium]